MRAYYRKNAQASSARGEAWRRKNPEKLKEYARRAARKAASKRYGITFERYEEMMLQACAICGSKERPCIDHCHERNVVRDTLCRCCNSGLGLFKDSPELLRAAAHYIELHRRK